MSMKSKQVIDQVSESTDTSDYESDNISENIMSEDIESRYESENISGKHKHQCTKCEYCTTRNHLKQNTASTHEQASHQCTKCEYKSTTKNKLRKHTMVNHQDQMIILAKM